MNKVHQVVWNAARRVWMAVSEKARGNGNLLSYVLGCAALFAAVAAGAPSASALGPGALPTGGQIVSGSGSISQSGNRMKINQQSQKMIADWMTFNIGSAAGVTFVQPNSSSAALNLISDQNPSQILGSLTANGKVFLLNPNGIIFGSTARIDVGGLVASSLSLSNADFLAGRYNFVNSGGAGAIVNQGSITAAPQGVVALIAPQVTNQGTITAPGGTVALAAGNRVSLDFVGDGLINVSVDEAALNAAVQNSGVVKADGGKVLMTAQAAGNLMATVINNTGVIEANSAGTRNGVIVLSGGSQGVVSNSGTITARGDNPGETGGTVTVTGYDVGLRAGSVIDVSGASGGGQVYVGGGFHGANPNIANANAVIMAPGAGIIADATQNGNGGKVALWSENFTNFEGNISARGGPRGGNGGYVETSSKGKLDFSGGTVNTLAPLGKVGTWLLDPSIGVIINPDRADTLESELETTSEIVTSGAYIYLEADIISNNIASGAKLTLEAGTDIVFYANKGINITGAHGLDVLLDSNRGNAGGHIYMASGSYIKSNSGYIKMGTGAHAATGDSGNYNGIMLKGATLDSRIGASDDWTGAGAITLKGNGYSPAGNTGGVGVQIGCGTTINGGAVTITGTGGNGGSGANGGSGIGISDGTITTTGAITLIGIGGSGSDGGFGGAGIGIGMGAHIYTTTGAIAITGLGGNDGNGGNGIQIDDCKIRTGSGAITLIGLGGLGGAGGIGIYATGTPQSLIESLSGGNITLIADTMRLGSNVTISTSGSITYRDFTQSTSTNPTPANDDSNLIDSTQSSLTSTQASANGTGGNNQSSSEATTDTTTTGTGGSSTGAPGTTPLTPADFLSQGIDAQNSGDFKTAAANFRGGAALLLQQGSLPEARAMIEMMQTAELQDYFQDSSLGVEIHKTSLKDIPKDSAIVYTMVLPGRVEMILGFNSGMKRFSIPVDTAALTQDINKFRVSLERRTSWDYSEEAQKLYNLLIKPLETELAFHGTGTLVFMPDGALRTIPFGALHDGNRFLIEKYSVAVSPGLNLTDSRPFSRKHARMLSVGLTEARQGFSSLDNVQGELDGIQTIYNADRIENDNFSFNNVHQSLEDNPYSMVHIATHGKLGPSATETFLLAWDEKINMNQVGQLMKESETRKTPVGLLCLSACETATGDDKAALGLAGLAVKSGARSAMATLWSVSDQAASNLVVDFYNQLKDPGVSKAEALREAQLKLLENPQYRHPFYWAPFLMIGNWQ